MSKTNHGQSGILLCAQYFSIRPYIVPKVRRFTSWPTPLTQPAWAQGLTHSQLLDNIQSSFMSPPLSMFLVSFFIFLSLESNFFHLCSLVWVWLCYLEDCGYYFFLVSFLPSFLPVVFLYSKATNVRLSFFHWTSCEALSSSCRSCSDNLASLKGQVL